MLCLPITNNLFGPCNEQLAVQSLRTEAEEPATWTLPHSLCMVMTSALRLPCPWQLLSHGLQLPAPTAAAVEQQPAAEAAAPVAATAAAAAAAVAPLAFNFRLNADMSDEEDEVSHETVSESEHITSSSEDYEEDTE